MAAIYIVIQRGMYRHNIIGAALSITKAKEMAEKAMREESDHYHDLEVTLVNINDEGEEVLTFLTCGDRVLHIGERNQKDIKNMLWNENDVNIPKRIPDHIQQFVLDVLNQDPMAMDAVEDILTGKKHC